MDLVYSIILVVSGFAIGFVGGLVGLVLGVVRFPVPKATNLASVNFNLVRTPLPLLFYLHTYLRICIIEKKDIYVQRNEYTNGVRLATHITLIDGPLRVEPEF